MIEFQDDKTMDLIQNRAEFKARYGIGDRYLDAYLNYWNGNCQERRVSQLSDLTKLPPPFIYWIEYALSTNQRGEAVFQLMKPHIRTGASRCLDVGCGFGGLTVAFARHGFDARGVDIDPERVDFAKLNALDNGLVDNIEVLDILGPLAKKMGPYDAITCTDVIEHVLDPRRTMEILIEMLAPGGTLLLEIPNKDSLHFVTRDGHFGLFGITQLDRPEAIEYHRTRFSAAYDVGHYHEFDYYVEIAKQQGCRAFSIPNSMHPPRDRDAVGAMLDELRAEYDRYLASTAVELPESVTVPMGERLGAYVGALWKKMAELARRPETMQVFQSQYLTEFWTLIVHKP